ncbi:PKD domain-containing protein, partial [Haloplanus sp.]|uniref:PKD domain-containing protein n=1 Tax=Haloplanus sp. TaxID=1961696 RepID=UPI0026160192
DGGDGDEPTEPTVTAAIAANQTGVYPDDAISFNASGSEGTNLEYNWTFGDGTNDTGETVEHAYAVTGTYNVTLTVANGSASDTDRIAVSVVEPVEAAITAEQTSGAVGEIIEFDALDSTSEDRSANVTYEWDFGDGTTLTDGVVAHEYDTAGTYTVTLTATDTVTGDTTTDTVEVVIEEGTDDEVPGFGPLVALIALLVSALVARSRD